MYEYIRHAHDLAKLSLRSSIATKTNVGVCITAKKGDDSIIYFQGANLENSYKKTYHAEEVALIQGLMEGYVGKEFMFMVQPSFKDKYIYPCCLSCLAFLWEYTHPEFVIYVTNSDKEIVYKKSLKELVSGFGGLEYIFPQDWRIWTAL